MKIFSTEVAVEPKAVSRAGEQAHDFLLAAGVDQRAAHHAALILDEILTNVILHGGAPKETATVQIEVDAEYIRGEIRDSGLPFDPRVEIDAERHRDVSERDVGGLGLHIVRNIASELDYTRDGGRNFTRFSVRRTRSHCD
jgi:anti-sigma regulatory factor (Ser/Thr protein kinase)